MAVAIIPEETGAPRRAAWTASATAGPYPSPSPLFGRGHLRDCHANLIDAFGRDGSSASPTSIECDWQDGFESAVGIYVNFARTRDAVYVPTFGHATADAEALELVTAHADRPPIAINASAVAIMGGSVRCLSTFLWGTPAEQLVALRAGLPSPAPPPPPVDDSGPLAAAIGISSAAGALLILLLSVANVWKARRERKAATSKTEGHKGAAEAM